MTRSAVPLSAVADVLRADGLLVGSPGPEDVSVRGVSQDSRSVEEGDLFLAWEGVEHDAHDYLDDVARSGAAAAVVERPRADLSLPQLHVSDGRRAGALAADRVMGSPWREMRTVGVTGTNGKTTTTMLTRHLLARRGPAAAIGTLGLVEATGQPRAGTVGLTTPGPVQLSRWLRELADDGVESVVVEASSHALEQRRLDGIRFSVAVYTNLSRDHLDYHADRDAYFDAKARLLTLMDEDGTVVVNADEEAWRRLPVGRLERIDFSTDGGAGLRASDVELDAAGCDFRLDAPEWSGDIRLPLPGRFNVENALAATGAALALGEAPEAVAAALAEAPQIPGRLEVVVREPFTVLIDFAHTPDALRRVLETLRPLAPGRLTVLFGAGGDRDREKRPEMARAVAGLADRIVVTSDNPRTEDPDRIIDDVVAGFEGTPYERITDRREAIAHVLETARKGEMVLLAGKGHETYQVVGTEKREFDERVVVRECLAAGGARS